MRKRFSKFGLIGITLAASLAAASPALASRWIQGHYGPNGVWHRGHWVDKPDIWISGHYGPGGIWRAGHWAGGFGPPPGPREAPPGAIIYGHHWAPGFYDPRGGWHPGYWAPN